MYLKIKSESQMKYNKIQFYFLILLFSALALFPDPIFAQKASKQQVLLNKSKELIYSDPDEALKIGLHLLKNSGSTDEKGKINILISKIYSVKGDYNNALHYLFQADSDASLTAMDVIEIHVLKSGILRNLYLDAPSKKYLEMASAEALLMENEKEKAFIAASITLEKTMLPLDRQNYKEALKFVQEGETAFAQEIKNNQDLDLWFAIAKGRIYGGLNDYVKGSFYFSKALELLDKSNVKNSYAEVYVLTGLATIDFHKKDHRNAIAMLLKALNTAQRLGNLYLARMLNKQLAINYIALNDSSNYKLYNSILLKTQSEVDDIEEESVNTAYNLIAKEYEDGSAAKRSKYGMLLAVVLFLFVAVITACCIVWVRFQWKKKRLKEIINYLEVTRNNLIIRFTEKKEISKKVFIPQETEQVLLTKLKRFENSKRFTNNDMSLAVLAGQFETNTKYLSEVINKHYNVNFNTYINKLRINYIVEKLKSDANFMNYKISYLAETCGFSSHSSFATVFKSITGIAPITFIELLKDEKETVNS
jgi:AraC-like DNA-binding protein